MRIKGKYVAEITITIDTKASLIEGMTFEQMREKVCEELTPMLRGLMYEEVIDPQIGEAKVTQVFAELHEVDE